MGNCPKHPPGHLFCIQTQFNLPSRGPRRLSCSLAPAAPGHLFSIQTQFNLPSRGHAVELLTPASRL
jgi:hypothetical protein